MLLFDPLPLPTQTLLGVPDAATLLGVSERRVWELVEEGALRPALNLNWKAALFTRSAVLTLVPSS